MLLFETLKIKKSHFLNSSQVNALHMAFNQTYGQIFTLTIATDEHHTSKQQTFVAIVAGSFRFSPLFECLCVTIAPILCFFSCIRFYKIYIDLFYCKLQKYKFRVSSLNLEWHEIVLGKSLYESAEKVYFVYMTRKKNSRKRTKIRWWKQEML